jgi:hypothetical protein
MDEKQLNSDLIHQHSQEFSESLWTNIGPYCPSSHSYGLLEFMDLMAPAGGGRCHQVTISNFICLRKWPIIGRAGLLPSLGKLRKDLHQTLAIAEQ